ncbi:hypothetical protein GLOIN_2v1772276 [Rhizophagus irregularis DAOM 181602=DAOM 197198]|nr:hypothetical protein GLOIN_2v1772276 [Rhizophagus irregularis DAOM 181602=DAOM 197198]
MAHNRYLKDWETLDNITKNHKKSYDTFSDAANIARRRQHHNSRSLYPNAIKGGVDTFYPDVDVRSRASFVRMKISSPVQCLI